MYVGVQDAPKAVTALKKLNVPYLVSLPLVFQTTEEWMDSELGVHPVQVALQVTFLTPLVETRRSCFISNLLGHHQLPERGHDHAAPQHQVHPAWAGSTHTRFHFALHLQNLLC